MSLFRNLCLKYFSDKTKLPGGRGHCYEISYENIFKHIDKEKVYNLLEIGIGLGGHYYGMLAEYPGYTQGSSLKLWSEYFPNSNIYGWDIEPCDYIDNVKIKTSVVDACDENCLNNFFKQNDIMFDIIIDDGSHQLEDQVKSFMLLYNKVNINGFYIIEDILPDNIELFQNLQAFPPTFVNEIINKYFKVEYHDTRQVSGVINDFIISFKKIC
jgi:hypothetical protein